MTRKGRPSRSIATRLPFPLFSVATGRTEAMRLNREVRTDVMLICFRPLYSAYEEFLSYTPISKMLKIINKRKCMWCDYEFTGSLGYRLIKLPFCPRCHYPFTRKIW